MSVAGWRSVAAGAVGVGILVGCAGAHPEPGAYLVRSKGYRVVPPAGWERIPSDADLALRQPILGAGLMAHATCEGKTPGRPLPLLARHLRFGLKDVADLQETPAAVAGRPALRSRFTARLDGVPVAVEAVTLAGSRCVYDLVAVAPPATLAAVTPDLDRFAESLRLGVDP